VRPSRRSELLRCAPQKRRVADRFCRRQEQQPPRVKREPRQPPREALLDSGSTRAARQEGRTHQPVEQASAHAEAPEARAGSLSGDVLLEYGLSQPRREDGSQKMRPHPRRLERRHWSAGSGPSFAIVPVAMTDRARSSPRRRGETRSRFWSFRVG